MHCYSALAAEPALTGMQRTTADPSQVLLSVGGLVGQEVNLDEFLSTLVDRVAATLEADRGTLYLLDPARQELFSRAGHLPEISQIRLKIGQGVAGYVAETGESVMVPDETSKVRLFTDIDKMTGYRTTSMLAVPLLDRARSIFGVVAVLNKRGGARFTQDDRKKLEEMAAQISTVLQATSLYQELQRAKEQPQAPVGYFFNRIIGESSPMKAIYKVVQKAAGTDATVLVRGESGSGKELIARAVHVNSPRREKPFVKVDCAALPPTLIENELFGHEKGAFTGADHRVEGKFESAHGGTVFIDELGELPQSVQGKLLRVIQDREFERVGGTQTIRVDVRIVAATNRDLARMVAEGKFREDLYYRIKVVEVVLPPLRDRGREDVERLARHFVAQAAKKHRLPAVPKLSASALERLQGYRWPGNVRELENCMESAVVLTEGEILAEQLPLPSLDRLTPIPVPLAQGRPPPPPGLTPAPLATPVSPDADPELLPLAEVERRHILRVLDACRGNRTAASKALQIGRNTLARKLKEYGFADEEGAT